MAERSLALHDDLDAFVAEVLKNPEAKAAFEDSSTQHAVIDGLLARRKELGWSQAEVARRMGCDRKTVARFEMESAQPTIQAAQLYARVVGMQLTIYLGWSE